MPRLLVEKGPDRGKTLTVAAGKQVTVGRDPRADLYLSDALCSRRHFFVASKGSVFGLKDLGSANGTLVNGKPAREAVRLVYGDSIQAGETLLSWLDDEQGKQQGGLIGCALGGYGIEERLGRGAMGTVYKATQLSLGRTVALKVLSPELVRDRKFCDMFIKEARAAGALNHPNIIQVYDVGEEDGQYYFSMEYAGHGSVMEELGKTGKLEMPRATAIIKDACRALDYAEKKGLVHRDIKPDNLMVTEDGVVKLGDLGLAMSAQELQAEQEGVFGTPHYIAPEQAMGKAIDHRADIYALGATFYRMLAGRTLFSGTTVREILRKQVREAPPPLSEILPGTPMALETIISRMLAKSPEDRYQHAADILADLDNWDLLRSRRSQVDSVAFGSSPDLAADEPAGKSRLPLAIGAAVASLAALAAVLWIFVFSGPGAPDNGGPVAEGNTPANGSAGGGSNETPEAVRKANEGLRVALGLAERLFKDGKPQAAVEELDAALARHAKAEQGVIDEARKRRKEISDLVEGTVKLVDDASREWDDLKRAAAGDIEEFRFEKALMAVLAFQEKYEESEVEGVKAVGEQARAWLKDGSPSPYMELVGARMKSHEEAIDQRLDEIQSRPAAERLAEIEELISVAAAAEEACDDAKRKGALKGITTDLEDLAGKVRTEIAREETLKLEAALEIATLEFDKILREITRDIRRGDYAQAVQRLADFESDNEEYRAYKDQEVFSPLLDGIARRRSQTRLEMEALEVLQNGGLRGGLPGIAAQMAILLAHPWPEKALALMGEAGGTLRLTWSARGHENWYVEIFVSGRSEKHTASTFSPEGRNGGAGLAQAVLHLLQHDSAALDKLKKKSSAEAGGAPLLAGVWAWLAEMGEWDESFEVMNLAYNSVGVSDPDRPVLCEYMAYALLGKARAVDARAAAAQGAEAEALKKEAGEYRRRFRSDEFKGTRARLLNPKD